VPHTWDTTGGESFSVEELAQRVCGIAGIEGVTFLGGEPFDQADALANLAMQIRAAGLSVVTFTGYQLESLVKIEGAQRLIDATDLLIDGPFVESQADFARPWIGSTNQRYHCVTARYASLSGQFQSIPNRLELRIAQDGQLALNGLATSSTIRELLAAVTHVDAVSSDETTTKEYRCARS